MFTEHRRTCAVAITLLLLIMLSKSVPRAATGAAKAGGPKVVVIGSGLAGLAAAMSCVEESRKRVQQPAAISITILEREARPGGNSMKASSGMNALTPASGDTPELFLQDTAASGGKLSDERLVAKLVVRGRRQGPPLAAPAPRSAGPSQRRPPRS
jgi:glycine/D-amino acid oxidase-like deaminating enzyme